MCGIWAHISSINKDYYEYFKKISHRGPDASNYMKLPELAIGFHRLAIVEKSFKGMQPFLDKNLIFVCNGEIYNYLDLNSKYKIENCNNDCQCILELYKKLTFNDFIDVITKEIIGEFAFIIFQFDEKNKLSKFISSRDIFGVRPLYYAKNNNDFIFSSELKGIPPSFTGVKEFPCGNIYYYDYMCVSESERAEAKRTIVDDLSVCGCVIYLFTIGAIYTIDCECGFQYLMD